MNLPIPLPHRLGLSRLLGLLCAGVFVVTWPAPAETIKNPDGTTTQIDKVDFGKPPKVKKVEAPKPKKTETSPPDSSSDESKEPPPEAEPPFYGKGTRQTTRDKDGNIIKEEYFDNKGNLREVIFHETKGGKSTKTGYRYREDKTPVEKSEESTDRLSGTRDYRWVFYGPDGKTVIWGWKVEDGVPYKWNPKTEQWERTYFKTPYYYLPVGVTFDDQPEQRVFFPENETNAEAFFVAFVGGGGNHTVTRTRVEDRERTVGETVTVSRTALVFDGVGFRSEVVNETQTTERTVTERREIDYQQNLGLYDDYAVGGGIGVNQFFGNWGVGGEFSLLSGYSAIQSVNASLTYRHPIIVNGPRKPFAVAPYIFAGVGGQFGDEDLFTGHIGAGVEVRLSPRCGVFADARWTVGGGDDNWATIRTGVRIPFGRGAEPTGTAIIPPR